MIAIAVSALAVAAVFAAGCSQAPSAGDIIEVTGVQMVYVPGGEFTIGDSSGDHARIALQPYLMARTEVTNGEFREFAELFNLGFAVPRAYDDLPIVSVSWETADAYAAWKGMRLPTEAEWEYAARGTDGRTYPWGNRWIPANANGNDAAQLGQDPSGVLDGFIRLAPTGLFPDGASPWGVYDMAGNVWEWTSDWHGDYPDADTVVVDWRGPPTGERKIMRGGSCTSARPNLRAFHRAYLPASLSRTDLGIRLASNYPPLKPGELPTGMATSGVINVGGDAESDTE